MPHNREAFKLVINKMHTKETISNFEENYRIVIYAAKVVVNGSEL